MNVPGRTSPRIRRGRRDGVHVTQTSLSPAAFRRSVAALLLQVYLFPRLSAGLIGYLNYDFSAQRMNLRLTASASSAA